MISTHAANHFDQSTSSKIDTRTTPPGGKLKSIHCDFSAVLALIFLKLAGIVNSMNMHNMAKFQRGLNTPTRDVHNFTEIVRLNEMETKNILQSEPMKLKPSRHAAASLPSNWLSDWLAEWMNELKDRCMKGGCMEGRKDSWMEERKEGRKENERMDGLFD